MREDLAEAPAGARAGRRRPRRPAEPRGPEWTRRRRREAPARHRGGRRAHRRRGLLRASSEALPAHRNQLPPPPGRAGGPRRHLSGRDGTRQDRADDRLPRVQQAQEGQGRGRVAPRHVRRRRRVRMGRGDTLARARFGGGSRVFARELAPRARAVGALPPRGVLPRPGEPGGGSRGGGRVGEGARVGRLRRRRRVRRRHRVLLSVRARRGGSEGEAAVAPVADVLAPRPGRGAPGEEPRDAEGEASGRGRRQGQAAGVAHRDAAAEQPARARGADPPGFAGLVGGGRPWGGGRGRGGRRARRRRRRRRGGWFRFRRRRGLLLRRRSARAAGEGDPRAVHFASAEGGGGDGARPEAQGEDRREDDRRAEGDVRARGRVRQGRAATREREEPFLVFVRKRRRRRGELLLLSEGQGFVHAPP